MIKRKRKLFDQNIRLLVWLIVGMAAFGGCKMTAPMHVWKSSQVPKPGAVRVAIAPIGGAGDATERMQVAMRQAQPNPNPMVAALHPQELAQVGGIQLVSYDNQPNDMATLAAARQSGMDYILQGHVIDSYLDVPPPDPNEKKRFRIFKKKPKPEFITVHWRVIDVPSGQQIKDQTISINRIQAEKQYPDLAYHASGGDGKVLMASARESWSLVAPTTKTEQAMLDLPWFAPGSSRVRTGNGYARQGRWDLAEKEWQEAADQHPWNKAAWTNLSLAAASREDFTLARSRLKHADTFWPGDSTFPTLTWIEQRQRNYHQSLGLEPPTTGWSLPDPPKPVGADQVPSSPPRDLKQMPWWTAIPFIPPPGWTWKQWWSQPIVL